MSEESKAIFKGLDGIIDSNLGIDKTWTYRGSELNYAHKKTLLKLWDGDGADFNGLTLVKSLFDCVNNNWNKDPRINRANAHNWRRLKNLEFDPKSKSDEVTLERVITQTTDDNWWNQIPVEEGMLGITRGKVVDLVHRDGENGKDFELIELKTDFKKYTPLSAAGQVLKYGIVYAFYRNRYQEILGKTPTSELLLASRLTLVVLAPWMFYEEFRQCDWLVDFEKKLNEALASFSSPSKMMLPTMGFKLQTFPKDFRWAAKSANEIQSQKEALWAVHNRSPVFS